MSDDRSATSTGATAASWPEEVFAAALVSGPGEGRLPSEALELMESLAGRRRPAILVSLVPGVGMPDEGSESEEAPGLTAVVRGDATLKEAARARPDRPFAFIAAGRDAEARQLLDTPALARLARGIRSAGGILLVHVPAGLEATPPVWLDGRVVAGDVPPEDGFGSDLPLLARLSAEQTAAAGTSPRWRRHRKERDAPWARIGAAVAGIVIILAGWWFLARETVQSPEGAGGETPGAAAVASDTGRSGADRGRSGTDRTAPTDTAGAAEGAAVGDTAPPEAAPSVAPLPYSVLVASYIRAADAAARVDRMRESLDLPVFVAPTTVGDRLYYRVFAGARTDTTAAGALMRDLADRGLKRSTSGWDLRPVRWSLLLGRYPTDSAARRALRGLGANAAYAYLLREPGARDTSYLLYAGAYRASSGARPLQEILGADGQETDVMIRRGEPR